VNEGLLKKLNDLPYYGYPYPKSLANNFGTEEVYPLIMNSGCSLTDALRTYVEHISIQIARAVSVLKSPVSASDNGKNDDEIQVPDQKLLATGGGVLNTFLMERIKDILREPGIEVVIPEESIIQYKEALIMALIGVLRWREESNTMASVTGASRNGIGGAVWIGQEA
jgi:anhydro-N-acetylmuramic acid kinase